MMCLRIGWMLFDRSDEVINLFEIKFYNQPFVVSKAYAEQLQNRIRRFQELSGTHKQIFLTLITTLGLKHNVNSKGLVSQELQLVDLFT